MRAGAPDTRAAVAAVDLLLHLLAPGRARSGGGGGGGGADNGAAGAEIDSAVDAAAQVRAGDAKSHGGRPLRL